jgi:hypothetical protein
VERFGDPPFDIDRWRASRHLIEKRDCSLRFFPSHFGDPVGKAGHLEIMGGAERWVKGKENTEPVSRYRMPDSRSARPPDGAADPRTHLESGIWYLASLNRSDAE